MRGGHLEADTAYSEAMVRDACQGNRRAFGELFRLLYPRIHRTVWAMLGDESEAHDVAQSAWIKAWDKRQSYNFQSLYTTWVHRIAVNCALDALRRRKRLHQRFVRFFSSGEPSAEPPPADEPVDPELPDEALARKELGRAIEAAVANLPDDQRTVLVLREFDGYSYAEIAKVLGLKPGTVMSRLHNARKKLQTSLPKDLS